MKPGHFSTVRRVSLLLARARPTSRVESAGSDRRAIRSAFCSKPHLLRWITGSGTCSRYRTPRSPPPSREPPRDRSGRRRPRLRRRCAHGNAGRCSPPTSRHLEHTPDVSRNMAGSRLRRPGRVRLRDCAQLPLLDVPQQQGEGTVKDLGRIATRNLARKEVLHPLELVARLLANRELKPVTLRGQWRDHGTLEWRRRLNDGRWRRSRG